MKPESSDTRTAEINAALLPAYANASKLKLTKAETKKLTRPFQESIIEIRPNDGVIWIPHIYLSQRLNSVFGPGSWALVCRDHFFSEDDREVQAEFVLIVKGCFIGEEVGEHPFNALAGEKYSDALACIAAKALRRICGLKLSCGSELWQPTYCTAWQAKYAETFAGEIFNGRENIKAALWRKKGAKSTLSESETPTPRAKKYEPTEDDRFLMLQCLSTLPQSQVLKFAIAQKILTKGQTLENWPLEKVAVGEVAIRKLQSQIIGSFPSAKPESKNWQDFEIPFGAMKGRKLGTLDKSDLAGYWQVRKEIPASFKDFHDALEAGGKHHGLQELKGRKK